MKSLLLFSLIFFWCSIDGNNSLNCGKRQGVVGRLHGGSQVERSEWPWLVAFIYKEKADFCGAGSLVSEKFVISSANTFHFKGEKNQLLPEELTAILGAHDLSQPNQLGSQKSDISEIIIHQDWNATEDTNYDADIAIVVLSKPAIFTNYVQPICLPPATSSPPKLQGTVVSWGATENSNPSVEIPHKLDFPVYNGTYCLLTYNNIVYKGSLRTFCGGYSDKGRGLCTLDSGSGFYTLNRTTGSYELVGISSNFLTENENCEVNKFSIFTNVNWFIGWFENETSRFS